ncbi:TIGR04282 family arsenosugar biosynthesis glycosyltransferase [Candidatus Parabeggiatoa sp. HSG14]|uniref:TIGR04282 family arsenosugar biosynthesis glycosyltransferase n=1 Tax=Candidatus Parabeggiatoa sp. HSG14 TaxID=3055593 RepID=UPI0025A7F885|nr:TIGR04282 family arsenosugar biosynthesis glycosyltransferase [Thiotrichales bacterium HSG14]
MTENVLQLFAKAPIPGKVKTRLIPKLGAVGAAILHQQLVKHCLQQFSGLFSIQLWCTPDEYHPFFQACKKNFNVSLYRQQGTDLGERMAYALASTPQPTVLIGSDSPSLDVPTIRDAFTALQQDNTIVLAPAEDGGYVLIGMRQMIPELFTNMPWSTSQVLTLTQARLQELGLSWKKLEMQWDIDRPEDVERWYALRIKNGK